MLLAVGLQCVCGPKEKEFLKSFLKKQQVMSLAFRFAF